MHGCAWTSYLGVELPHWKCITVNKLKQQQNLLTFKIFNVVKLWIRKKNLPPISGTVH